MMRWQAGPPPYLTFTSFPGGQRHGVFTRLGGVSRAPFDSLNQSRLVGDIADSVEQNLGRAQAVLHYESQRLVNCQQVHGRRVAVVTADEAGSVLPATDGMVTNHPGVVLTMRYADCVPVLFYSAARRAVGIAHAGWRGTLQRVAAATVESMSSAFGCDPAEIVAGIGPSIGPCCFEVGPEVAAQFEATFPDTGMVQRQRDSDRAYVDLWRANVAQLREIGLAQIELSELCTVCRQALFYSHRGSGGRTGRFAAYISVDEAYLV